MSNGTPKERPARQFGADEAVALLEAAAGGHDQTLAAMLSRGVDLSATDPQHGNTGLHEAAWRGHSRCVRVLARGGAPTAARNSGGFCPLHLAAQNGHNQSVREMLLAGADPDLQNNYGDTALHTACRYGHAGATLILLSGRCRPGIVNLNGDSALHIASAMGRRKLTRILLSAGCDAGLRNAQGETARDIAVRKGLIEILDILDAPPPANLQYHTRNEEKSRKKKEDRNLADDNLRGYHLSSDRRKLRNLHFDPNGKKWSPYGCHYFPDPNSFPKPRLDSVPKEPLGKGEQYFLDLAGNICKGPVGVGHTCYCAPFFKHLEDRMSSNRKSLKRYINRRTERLDNRVTQLAQKADGRLDELSKTLVAERAKCSERHLHLEQWLTRGRHRASAAIARRPPPTAVSTLTRSKSLELLDSIQTTVQVHADSNGRTLNDHLSRSVDILDADTGETPRAAPSNASARSSDIDRIDVKSVDSEDAIEEDKTQPSPPPVDNFNASFISQATVIRKDSGSANTEMNGDRLQNMIIRNDCAIAQISASEKKRKPILKSIYNIGKQKIARAVESKQPHNHIDLSKSQAELSTLKKEILNKTTAQSTWKNNLLGRNSILKSVSGVQQQALHDVNNAKLKSGSLNNLRLNQPISIYDKCHDTVVDRKSNNIRVSNTPGFSCPTRINLFSRVNQPPVSANNNPPIRVNSALEINSPLKLSIPSRLSSPSKLSDVPRVGSPVRLNTPSRLSSPSGIRSPSILSDHTTISAPEMKVAAQIAQIENNIQKLIQSPVSHTQIYRSQPVLPTGSNSHLNKSNNKESSWDDNNQTESSEDTDSPDNNNQTVYNQVSSGYKNSTNTQTYENITPSTIGSSNLYVKPIIASPQRSAQRLDTRSMIPKDAYFHEMPNKNRPFMETHFSYSQPTTTYQKQANVCPPVQLQHPLVNIQNAHIQKTICTKPPYVPVSIQTNARSRHPLYNSNIDLNCNGGSSEDMRQQKCLDRITSSESVRNLHSYRQPSSGRQLYPANHTMSLSNLDLEISDLQSHIERKFTLGPTACPRNEVYQSSHDFQLNSPLDRILDLNHSPLDSHNDSGYSTKIYGSSQGPSPSLSGQLEYDVSGNRLTNMINNGIRAESVHCPVSKVDSVEIDRSITGFNNENINSLRPQSNGQILSSNPETDVKMRSRLLNKLHNAMIPKSNNIGASSLV